MSKLDEMRRINEAQQKYYQHSDSVQPDASNSAATNAYRRLRRRLLRPVQPVLNSVHDLHKEWLPNAVDRALDLGAGSGTEFSEYLAGKADNYVAVELSPSRVRALSDRLDGVDGTRIIQGDFLGGAVRGSFDVIYAASVLHHFKHLDVALRVVHDHLTPGGLVLTHDPLSTWLPLRMLRMLYRPFQTDREWEHPFDRSDFETIRRYFHPEESQGLLGYSKWAIPLGLYDESLARRKARQWHGMDLARANEFGSVRPCLQVAMKLRGKMQPTSED